MVEDKKTVSASIPPPPRLTGDAQTDNLSLMHWVNDFHRIAIVQGGLVQRAEHLAAQPEGQDSEAVREPVMNAVRAHFRAEFLNRLDDIIIFDPLTQDDILKIVDKMMSEIEGRVGELGVKVELSDAAREWLAKEGFDRMYGARPLKRAIQRYVENELSKRILSGGRGKGDLVKVDAGESGLTFDAQRQEEPEPVPVEVE